MTQINLKIVSLILLIGLLFSACGSTPGTSSVTGQFIDSPVQGLGYTCSSGTTGTTNSNGEYTCNIGDNVTFKIASVVIGTIAAQTTQITPYSLFPNDTTAALNLARLLQSLDTLSTDSIIILDKVKESKIPVDTNFTSASFETKIENDLNITLVSEYEAQTTMNTTILALGGNVPTNYNNIPIANANIDKKVNTASLVTLDASLSTDVNLDALTYLWSIISKPVDSNATLSNATIINPTFTVDKDGAYVFSLIVNDGAVSSPADTVIINAATTNSAPVANAGLPQNINTSATVTLDASASSDSNSDPIGYAWGFSSKPTGSTATLSNASAVNPTFTPDIDGSYVLQLIVSDGLVNSASATVTITATNVAPVAHAGVDQSVNTTETVTLDASGSSDYNSNPLSYAWSINSSPTGSTATFSNPSTANPTFTPDIDGSYVLQLMVSDGLVNSASATVTIIATNSVPVANAGLPQSINTTETVTLNGSRSSDSNSDPLTYFWSITSTPANSNATLSNATIINPTFTADKDGAYVFSLIVNDGLANSVSDTVTITATNSAPIANAGFPQNINTTEMVTLDASGSYDSNSDPLGYVWSITYKPTGSTATFSDASAVNPTFTPDVTGSYVLQLIVNDGLASSLSDTVTITATNSSPVANAGLPQNINTRATLTLDGSGSSDSNSDPLGYAWSIASQPTESTTTLSDASAIYPTFTPDVTGSYVLQLIVNDGLVNSASATVTITAINVAPVANAGLPQNINTKAMVALNASLSTDVNSDALTYLWSITSKPTNSNATLSNATIVKPTFTADKEGTYVFSLVVNDGAVSSPADTVTINASTANSSPVANAGVPQSVNTTETVTLDGSGSSDSNSDPLTYFWSITSTPANSNATLSNPLSVNPTFTPDMTGSYILELVVNDGLASSLSDTVTITATNEAPLANAGLDQDVNTTSIVTLDASGSSDSNAGSISYAWSFTSRPTGSTATFSDASAVSPTFTADTNGSYVIELVVNDGTINSSAQAITVTARSDVNDISVFAASGTMFIGQFNYIGEKIWMTDTVGCAFYAETGLDGPFVYLYNDTRNENLILNFQDMTITSDQNTFIYDIMYPSHVNNPGVGSSCMSAPVYRPVANGGVDQNIGSIGTTVTLDASASSTTNSGVLTYQWTLYRPTASTATLSDASVLNPTFVADKEGSYSVELTVNDGLLQSYSKFVRINVNYVPTAYAGISQNISTSDTVVLDTAYGFDKNSDPLTYAWSVVSKPTGSIATFSNSSIANPAFTPDLDGDYVLQLIVNDGLASSSSDVATLTALNTRPIANAGVAQNINTRATVTLDGSGSSDSNSDPLTYAWSVVFQPIGSSATLSDASAVNPTFTPDMTGSYILQLIANDGVADGYSRVTITATNSAPVANAGLPQNINRTKTVILDASGSSDSNSDPLTYAWSFTYKPTGSSATLSNASALNPTFTADVDGSYILQLIVNDRLASSASATVTITARNAVPVADAGLPQNINTTEMVTLDGSGSSDSNSDPLSYAWSITAKPTGSSATLSDASAVNPTFTPDVTGSYILQLIVNDGLASSASATVIITAVNVAPVANSGLPQNINTTETVTLDGSRSYDSNSDPLTYAWSFTYKPIGSSATLSDASAVNPTFTPDVTDSYVLQLIVNDGLASSLSDTVTITATNSAPVANAGDTQNINTITTVTLDGLGSSDSNSDPLTYAWSFTSKPIGSTTTLSDASAIYPTFTPDIDGFYVLQLIVDDGLVSSASNTVTIIFLNRVPAITSSEETEVKDGKATVLVLQASDSDSPLEDLSFSLTNNPGTDNHLFEITTFTKNTRGACRGTIAVADTPFYYTVEEGVSSLQECQAACTTRTNEWISGCKGVEFRMEGVNSTYPQARCELWTNTIVSTVPIPGYSCYTRSSERPNVLSFINAADFKTPLDADFNNIYKVEVEVSDGVHSSTQIILITVVPNGDYIGRVGTACRAGTQNEGHPEDLYNADYFTIMNDVKSLEDCQTLCDASPLIQGGDDCYGVEYRTEGADYADLTSRCELWKVPIVATTPQKEYQCSVRELLRSDAGPRNDAYVGDYKASYINANGDFITTSGVLSRLSESELFWTGREIAIRMTLARTADRNKLQVIDFINYHNNSDDGPQELEVIWDADEVAGIVWPDGTIYRTDWSNAKQAHSQAVYQEYIDNHYDETFRVEEAQRQIRELKWAIAETINTGTAYRDYIRDIGAYASGYYGYYGRRDEANKRIDALKFFVTAEIFHIEVDTKVPAFGEDNDLELFYNLEFTNNREPRADDKDHWSEDTLILASVTQPDKSKITNINDGADRAFIPAGNAEKTIRVLDDQTLRYGGLMFEVDYLPTGTHPCEWHDDECIEWHKLDLEPFFSIGRTAGTEVTVLDDFSWNTFGDRTWAGNTPSGAESLRFSYFTIDMQDLVLNTPRLETQSISFESDEEIRLTYEFTKRTEEQHDDYMAAGAVSCDEPALKTEKITPRHSVSINPPGFKIRNETDHMYSVSLNQVGPLYYGEVPPGKIFRRDTAWGHFTIDVILNMTGEQRYDDWDVAEPIALFTADVLMTAAMAGGNVQTVGKVLQAGVKGSLRKVATTTAARTVASSLRGNMFGRGFLRVGAKAIAASNGSTVKTRIAKTLVKKGVKTVIGEAIDYDINDEFGVRFAQDVAEHIYPEGNTAEDRSWSYSRAWPQIVQMYHVVGGPRLPCLNENNEIEIRSSDLQILDDEECANRPDICTMW
jgi:hypothetical protein